MRVEKISKNKVRIFISYEDLEARGIEKEEVWQNGKKVQELFWDMMEIAYSEVGFEIVGPIAVEAFTMPTEGVVVIVTQVPSLPPQSSIQDEDDEDDQDIDLFSSYVFVLPSFEEVVQVAKALEHFGHIEVSLYMYEQKYHLVFENDNMDESVHDSIWSVLHEYGELTTMTTAVLDEYGQCVVNNRALEVIRQHFV